MLDERKGASRALSVVSRTTVISSVLFRAGEHHRRRPRIVSEARKPVSLVFLVDGTTLQSRRCTRSSRDVGTDSMPAVCCWNHRTNVYNLPCGDLCTGEEGEPSEEDEETSEEYTHVGCFPDTEEARVLLTPLASPDMTIEVRFCKKQPCLDGFHVFCVRECPTRSTAVEFLRCMQYKRWCGSTSERSYVPGRKP